MSERPPKKSKPKQPQEQRLKAVVRRLPPNLPEQVFWQSVSPWVTDATCSWKEFRPGKLRKGVNKENVPSRAYIAFKNTEILTTFNREYDGHLFRDKQGNESTAVVEFAPFQKVPSEKKKPDARMGTIEEDPDYISFIESLNAPPAEPEHIEPSSPPPDPSITPLLAHLAAEKAAAKEREIIQQYHGHIHSRMTISQKQQERNKERIQEEREFSRNPLPAGGDTAPRNKGKAAASATASPALAPAGIPASGPAPSAQNKLSRKQRKDAATTPNPPRDTRGSPTKPPPKPSIAPQPSAAQPSETTADTAPGGPKTERKRPMFKFDAAVAGVIQPTGDSKDTKDGAKPSRRAKAREREKEKKDHVDPGDSNPSANPSPSRTGADNNKSPMLPSTPATQPSAPSSPSPRSRPPKPKAGQIQIQARPQPVVTPGATTDSVSQPAPTPPAGIIPISISSTERGRGGGRPRGRGRGGGRGGGPPRGGAPPAS